MGQHMEFNRTLEKRMEKVCKSVEVHITYDEFFKCLELKWLLTTPQRKAEAERKFNNFESWVREHPSLGLSEKWCELRKRERNLLIFGVAKLWSETVEVFLQAIGRKEHEHVRIHLYTEQIESQNDDGVCTFLRQYETNLADKSTRLGLSQSGKDPRFNWN